MNQSRRFGSAYPTDCLHREASKLRMVIDAQGLDSGKLVDDLHAIEQELAARREARS